MGALQRAWIRATLSIRYSTMRADDSPSMPPRRDHGREWPLLDYEAASEHFITVRATDQSGHTADKAFTIALTNVNEAPTDAKMPSLTQSPLLQRTAQPLIVGTVIRFDPTLRTRWAFRSPTMRAAASPSMRRRRRHVANGAAHYRQRPRMQSRCGSPTRVGSPSTNLSRLR